MSRSSHRVVAPSWSSRFINTSRLITVLVLILVAAMSTVNSSPITIDELRELGNDSSVPVTTISSDHNSTNTTENDLYVIRAVVYEIGILTDVDNSTNATTDRHEEVGISIYDPPHKENGLLDLSGIPLPVVAAPTTGIESQDNSSTTSLE